MAVQIESYQRISRPAIPANVAYVPPVGQQYETRARAIQGEATAGTVNVILEIIGKVASSAVSAWSEQQAKISAANQAAELSKETMSTVQEYTDEGNRLDAVENLPAPQEMNTEELLGLTGTPQPPQESTSETGPYGGVTNPQSVPAANKSVPTMTEADNWQKYYQQNFLTFTQSTIEKHLKNIRDPLVRAKYQEWVSEYVQKTYGDFITKGMVRDTNRAIADTNSALALAVEQKNKPMVTAILGAAQLGANPLITPDKARELQDALYTKIDENGFTEAARARGVNGPDWMMQAENQQAYNISPERAAELSKASQADLQVARAAKELADLPKRKQSYSMAINMIDQGKWSSPDEVDNPSWIDAAGNAFSPTLYDEDKDNIRKYWDAKAAAQQKAMDQNRDDALNIVNDSIKAGDYEGAQLWLDILDSKGYPASDLKIQRAKNALALAMSPDGKDEFGQDCVNMELKLVNGTMTLSDLRSFGKKWNTEPGQVKLAHFREGYEQQLEAGTKVSKDVEAKYEADYLQYFMKIYYSELVDEPALRKLSEWISRNSVNNETNAKMPGISPSYQTTWTAKIMDKIDDLRNPAKKLAADRLNAGRDQITNYFGSLIKKNAGNETKVGIYTTQQWNSLQTYDALAPNSKDPTATALEILKPFDAKYVQNILDERAKLAPAPQTVAEPVTSYNPIPGMPNWSIRGAADNAKEAARQAALSLLFDPYAMQFHALGSNPKPQATEPNAKPPSENLSTQTASEQRSRDMATLAKWKLYQMDEDGSIHFEGHKDAKGNYDWFEAYNTETKQWEKVPIADAQEYINAWTRLKGSR